MVPILVPFFFSRSFCLAPKDSLQLWKMGVYELVRELAAERWISLRVLMWLDSAKMYRNRGSLFFSWGLLPRSEAFHHPSVKKHVSLCLMQMTQCSRPVLGPIGIEKEFVEWEVAGSKGLNGNPLCENTHVSVVLKCRIVVPWSDIPKNSVELNDQEGSKFYFDWSIKKYSAWNKAYSCFERSSCNFSRHFDWFIHKVSTVLKNLICCYFLSGLLRTTHCSPKKVWVWERPLMFFFIWAWDFDWFKHKSFKCCWHLKKQ